MLDKINIINHIVFLLVVVTGHAHHQKNFHNKNLKSKQNLIISTKELHTVSEELFDMLPNHIFHSLSISFQGQRYAKDVKDEAPEPLLFVPTELIETIPTISSMLKLYDNYDINSLHAEYMTHEKDEEENSFIECILNTNIMMHTMDYLAKKGYFKKDIKEYQKILKKLWFTTYSRSNHTELGSSGFEHVFLVEKKQGNHLTGLHNWIFFAIEENNNKANYLGYIAKEKLSNKAVVLKFYFSYLGKIKLTSMFIGTPPEFEMAIYTLCFYVRPNKNCSLLLGKEKISIKTWVQYSNHEELLGSSYPQIYN